MVELDRQSFKTIAVADRLQLRTLTGGKTHPLSERVRHHQDIREQNRRIETKSPERL